MLYIFIYIYIDFSIPLQHIEFSFRILFFFFFFFLLFFVVVASFCHYVTTTALQYVIQLCTLFSVFVVILVSWWKLPSKLIETKIIKPFGIKRDGEKKKQRSYNKKNIEFLGSFPIWLGGFLRWFSYVFVYIYINLLCHWFYSNTNKLKSLTYNCGAFPRVIAVPLLLISTINIFPTC